MSTGGTLSVGSAVTDSQGRARPCTRASSTTSASNGVHVTASVGTTVTGHGRPDGGRLAQLFLSLRHRQRRSKKPNTRPVQDRLHRAGDGLERQRRLGCAGIAAVRCPGITTRASASAGAHKLDHARSTATCINEDRVTGNPAFDFNGILDPGENQNGNNNSGVPSMEAGNIASVTPANAVRPMPMDSCCSRSIYPQDYAYYLDVVLSASTTVQGTEYVRTSTPFLLAGRRNRLQQPATMRRRVPSVRSATRRAASTRTDRAVCFAIHAAAAFGRPYALCPMLGKRNIYLIGPMGTGKTAVGKQLGRLLGMPFIDSDAEIEHARRRRHPLHLRARRRGRLPPA